MPKIIHLSDLHFGAHDPMIVSAVEKRLDHEQAELVVISGDFTQRAKKDQFKEAEKDYAKYIEQRKESAS